MLIRLFKYLFHKDYTSSANFLLLLVFTKQIHNPSGEKCEKGITITQQTSCLSQSTNVRTVWILKGKIIVFNDLFSYLPNKNSLSSWLSYLLQKTSGKLWKFFWAWSSHQLISFMWIFVKSYRLILEASVQLPQANKKKGIFWHKRKHEWH